MSKLKTLTCPFCSKRNTFKYGMNAVCSCGAKYYTKSGIWPESPDNAALEKMREEMAELLEDFNRKMEDDKS